MGCATLCEHLHRDRVRRIPPRKLTSTLVVFSVPASVLAAPRVDYLVESGVKRQERERRVAQAIELQRQQRLEAIERSAFSPAGGRSPACLSASSQTGGSSGSPTTLLDRPPPPPISGDTTPFEILDFFNLGEGFMFPDLPSDHDPAMVRTAFPLASLRASLSSVRLMFLALAVVPLARPSSSNGLPPLQPASTPPTTTPSPPSPPFPATTHPSTASTALTVKILLRKADHTFRSGHPLCSLRDIIVITQVLDCLPSSLKKRELSSQKKGKTRLEAKGVA